MPTNFYPTIGTTTTPFFVPFMDSPMVAKTEQGYFRIQLYGAQAVFTGSILERAQRLAVMSQVNLHLDESQPLGEQDLRGILQYRQIEKNTAVQLGTSPTLVDFVPARMKRVSLTIEYLVDTQNYLRMLSGLISDKDLLATISLAPGAALVAEKVANLTTKLINTLIPEQERKPILAFSGDFDLAIQGVKAGYYVLLGSHTATNPLEIAPTQLEIKEGGILWLDGAPLTNLSYVILRVDCAPAIRDQLAGSAPWRAKLAEAKRLAQDYAEDDFSDTDARKQKEVWEKECLPLLREAKALMLTDSNFLPAEVEIAYRAAYRECQLAIKSKIAKGATTRGASAFDQAADRAFLGIGADENLEEIAQQYAAQLFQARRVFDALERS